jgi:hypothetical protein
MQSFEAELRHESSGLHLLFCERRLVAINGGKGASNGFALSPENQKWSEKSRNQSSFVIQ